MFIQGKERNNKKQLKKFKKLLTNQTKYDTI